MSTKHQQPYLCGHIHVPTKTDGPCEIPQAPEKSSTTPLPSDQSITESEPKQRLNLKCPECHSEFMKEQSKSSKTLSRRALKLEEAYAANVEQLIEREMAGLVSRIPAWVKQTETNPDEDKSIYKL